VACALAVGSAARRHYDADPARRDSGPIHARIVLQSDPAPASSGFSATRSARARAEAALRAVDQAMRACGGSAYYNTHELSRLYRDALAGLFQPSDQESLHAAWANLILGPIEKAQ